jgi:hypothetical protein
VVARAQTQKSSVDEIDELPSKVAWHPDWLQVSSSIPQLILDESIPAFSDGMAGHL